jgi:DNA polymerase-1
MMQIVAIAATEAGIQVCAPVHDAFWIMAPLDELDTAIARMKEIMIQASVAVTGGLPAGVTVEYVVRWPQCLGDVRKPEDRGQAMWNEVKDLLRDGRLQREVS